MSGIPALPEEILGLIFSHLSESNDPEDGIIDADDDIGEASGSRATLVSLCLVNKQCCRLARPLLYRTVRLFCEFTLRPESQTLRKLVRTLVYQPMFASYISKVWIGSDFLDDNLDEDDDDDDDDEEDSWDVSYEDAVDSSHAFDRDDQSRQELLDGLEDGSCDANIALLLAMCQDAKGMRIDLPQGFHSTRTFTGQVLSNAARGLDPSVESWSLALSSLKVLSMHDSDCDTILFSNIVNLFQLPNLEVFHGFGIDCAADSNQYETFTSDLRRISMDECLTDADGLGLILQGCPKLQDLAVVWTDNCEVDFAEIGSYLGRYGKRIEKLALEQAAFGVDSGGLGDLSQMTALATLIVPADILVGNDVRTTIILPISVEHLDIDLAGFPLDDDFREQLRAVVEHGKSHSLEVVNCGMGQGRQEDKFWSKANGYEV